MGVYVTKAFLPKFEEYTAILKKIWDSCILTNQGSCVRELEAKMKEYLDVDFFHYVSNGTIALQLALDALNIKSGEIVTTPFSYVATTSSILWERCKPVFVDIKPNDFTLDADKIEAAVTPATKAIMAVHVFGYPCEVDTIQKIADQHNLKVIYDGAHAFGVKYKGKSLLKYGDITTCSFHATKLFHTVEGGACIVKDAEASKKLDLAMRFGHNGDTYYQLGINGKQSELHAAMGLTIFPYLPQIIAERKRACDLYDTLLGGAVARPEPAKDLAYNYAYYPVLFANETELKNTFASLAEHEIYPRRYFYPSLNTLPYVERQKCPVSEDISSRIACLPLFVGLEPRMTKTIANTIKMTAQR
jgi:dTDP-4-amino-4,6-dideoxygalactose transaminase